MSRAMFRIACVMVIVCGTTQGSVDVIHRSRRFTYETGDGYGTGGGYGTGDVYETGDGYETETDGGLERDDFTNPGLKCGKSCLMPQNGRCPQGIGLAASCTVNRTITRTTAPKLGTQSMNIGSLCVGRQISIKGAFCAGHADTETVLQFYTRKDTLAMELLLTTQGVVIWIDPSLGEETLLRDDMTWGSGDVYDIVVSVMGSDTFQIHSHTPPSYIGTITTNPSVKLRTITRFAATGCAGIASIHLGTALCELPQAVKCDRVGSIHVAPTQECTNIGPICANLSIDVSGTYCKLSEMVTGGIPVPELTLESSDGSVILAYELHYQFDHGSPFEFHFLSGYSFHGEATIMMWDAHVCGGSAVLDNFPLVDPYHVCLRGCGNIHTIRVVEHDEYVDETLCFKQVDPFSEILDIYGEKNGDPKQSSTTNNSTLAYSEELVTQIGLSLSIVFLLLTVLVQIINGNVKTTPGKIVVSLAVSMFVAQALFLVKDQPWLSGETDIGDSSGDSTGLEEGAGVGDVTTGSDSEGITKLTKGQDQTGVTDPTGFVDIPRLRDIPCMVTAVVQHLAWLYTFSWSNAMVVDLYRVISFKHGVYRRSHTSRYPFYLTTASLVPIGVVSACLTLHFHFRFLRYGVPGDCWIKYVIAQIYFFALPIGVSLLVNIGLLVGVFVSIYQTRQATSALGDDAVLSHRRGAIIGLKLAAVMGLTWIFGFVGGFLKNAVLLYLFTVTNSLQGVAVFFAISYNHDHVTRWFRGRFRTNPPSTSDTPTAT